MDAITKALLNKFSESQPALQLPGVPAADAGVKLGDLIAAGSNPVAGTVAAIPASADLTVPVVTATTFASVAVVGTYVDGAEPTGAEVDTTANAAANAAIALVKAVADIKADNADLVTLGSEVESRMDAVEGKINAVIAALKAAGLMA